jgi:hypothetical protein
MVKHLKYTKHEDRLSDVLALIQMFGLDREDRYSEQQAIDELGPARSAERWTVIAEEHPEFFRVRPADSQDPQSTGNDKTRLSLLARHTWPHKRTDLFPMEFVEVLMRTAIDLHDREVTRHDKRSLYVALIAAAGGIAATVIGAVIAVAVKIIFHTS